MTYSISGTYGSNQTDCTILIYETIDGGSWYCVKGSVNVNLTYTDLNEGVDIENVADADCFTWSSPINTLEELEQAVEF